MVFLEKVGNNLVHGFKRKKVFRNTANIRRIL